MLAEVAARLRRYAMPKTCSSVASKLAPSFDAARHNYAVVLNRQAKPPAALRQVEQLLAKEPRNPGYLNLQAAVLANLGDYADSIAVYEARSPRFSVAAEDLDELGHALRTAGRVADSVSAYRRAIAMDPTLGEAYWSLANLKTFRFSPADTEAMRTALARADLTDEDRLHFEFSLGKALEDAQLYAAVLRITMRGQRASQELHPYDAGETTRFVRRSKQLWTPRFLRPAQGAGRAPADPIFIVGMPRAGSTLLEQILSSHSLVEGTTELPDIPSWCANWRDAKSGIGAPFFEPWRG